MHELGLCEAILERVEHHAGGRPVARVTIVVGRLHLVDPDAFAQSFALAAAGGVAEGALAQLRFVAARVRCRACGAQTDADVLPDACGQCGALDLEVSGGDELVVESIEYRA